MDSCYGVFCTQPILKEVIDRTSALTLIFADIFFCFSGSVEGPGSLRHFTVAARAWCPSISTTTRLDAGEPETASGPAASITNETLRDERPCWRPIRIQCNDPWGHVTTLLARLSSSTAQALSQRSEQTDGREVAAPQPQRTTYPYASSTLLEDTAECSGICGTKDPSVPRRPTGLHRVSGSKNRCIDSIVPSGPDSVQTLYRGNCRGHSTPNAR